MKIKSLRTRYLTATALSLFLFLAVFGLSGCGGGGGSSSVPTPTFSQEVTGIGYKVENAGVGMIMPAALEADVEGGNQAGYYLVDLREPIDYNGIGHIPGAVNIPLQSLFCGGASAPYLSLPTNTTIILISYAGMWEANAATVLQMMGYNVSMLRFGMSSWDQSTYGFTPSSASGVPNYPIVKSSSLVLPTPPVNVYSNYSISSSFVSQLGADACAAFNPNGYGPGTPPVTTPYVPNNVVITSTGAHPLGTSTSVSTTPVPSQFNLYDDQFNTTPPTGDIPAVPGQVGLPVITATALYNSDGSGGSSFNAITDTNSSPYFIDSVRSLASYNGTGSQPGHIPGVHLNPNNYQFTPQYMSNLPTTGQAIVIHCYTGNLQNQVGAILRILGYNIIELRFGFSSWGPSSNYMLEAITAVPTTYPLNP